MPTPRNLTLACSLALLAALPFTALAASAPAAAKPAVAAPKPKAIPLIDETANERADVSLVSYLTGGIGEDERADIEADRGQYSLHISSARADGAFVENTRVRITNDKGEVVLDVGAGPLLYVDLPPGKYTLEAAHQGQNKTQKIELSAKRPAGDVHLQWRATVAATDEGLKR